MRAMRAGKHSGRGRMGTVEGCHRRPRRITPARPLPRRAPHRQRRAWRASGRRTTSCSTARVAVKVLAAHLSEDDRARAPLPARGARRRRAVLAPERRDDLRRRRARRPLVHRHGAARAAARVADRLARAARQIPHRVALRWLARGRLGARRRARGRASSTATSSPPTCCSTSSGRLALADFGIARLGARGPDHADRPGARHRRLHLARAGDGRAGDRRPRTATRSRSSPSSC